MKKKVRVEDPPAKVNTYHTNKVVRANPNLTVVEVKIKTPAEEPPAVVNNIVANQSFISQGIEYRNDEPRDVQDVEQVVNGKVATNLKGKPLEMRSNPDVTPPTDFVKVSKKRNAKG